MKRRSFLAGILAAGVAPHVVTKAGVLMPVLNIWTPEERNVMTPQEAALEGWRPLPGGPVSLDLRSKLMVYAPGGLPRMGTWVNGEYIPYSHAPYDAKGYFRQRVFEAAKNGVVVDGTLHGQPGRLERGIFIPSDVRELH